MNFVLQRIAETLESTRGALFASDGSYLCDILERGADDPQFPRIVAGTHALRFHGISKFDRPPYSYGARFASIGYLAGHMIEIVVPSRVAILFHCGNAYMDSEGCLMTGQSVVLSGANYVIPGGQSTPAFDKVWPILDQAVSAGSAQLEVRDIVAEVADA
jgi:Family of unknown function (DUF5675)